MRDPTNLYAVECDLLFQLVAVVGEYVDFMSAFLLNPQMENDIKIPLVLIIVKFYLWRVIARKTGGRYCFDTSGNARVINKKTSISI